MASFIILIIIKIEKNNNYLENQLTTIYIKLTILFLNIISSNSIIKSINSSIKGLDRISSNSKVL